MNILRTWGNDNRTDKPFIDLRYDNGLYTLNAIMWPYEYELVIGRRYTNKKLPEYINIVLKRLRSTLNKCGDGKFCESIRINKGWDLSD